MTKRDAIITAAMLCLFVGVVLGFGLGASVGSNVRPQLAGIQTPDIEAIIAERDEAVRERDFWRQAMKQLVEGDQPEMLVAGRASEGD